MHHTADTYKPSSPLVNTPAEVAPHSPAAPTLRLPALTVRRTLLGFWRLPHHQQAQWQRHRHPQPPAAACTCIEAVHVERRVSQRPCGYSRCCAQLPLQSSPALQLLLKCQWLWIHQGQQHAPPPCAQGTSTILPSTFWQPRRRRYSPQCSAHTTAPTGFLLRKPLPVTPPPLTLTASALPAATPASRYLCAHTSAPAAGTAVLRVGRCAALPTLPLTHL